MRRLATLLAIVGPGLIVTVGDNDAGAFSTYGQAGQDGGTALLWTLLPLAPVLYVNQEMALRLGAVTGVGHARLILARLGRAWGAWSLLDLFLLNALTIVTEFIGIDLALDYLGVGRIWGVAATAAAVIAATATGSFRRFERFSLALCFFSLLLVPVFVLVHPPLGEVARALVTPAIPPGLHASETTLLAVAIVGTTVAPWQLFFQQSYVADKRITPRFMAYARTDLAIGIVGLLIGAVAITAAAAAAFAGQDRSGHFTDPGAIARALETSAGRGAGIMFALTLIDASLIGTATVALTTAYAVGDISARRHSLHRSVTQAGAAAAAYAGLIVASAALVLFGSDALLGLLTNAVQALAGVLLPSATAVLLLLCNDGEVLGPWVNGRWLNLFAGTVISALVALSLALTATTVFPAISARTILSLLVCATLAGIAGFASHAVRATSNQRAQRPAWRTPPLDTLQPLRLTPETRTAMALLRAYLIAAAILMAVQVTQASSHP